jgi:hypothetical protein
LTPDCFVPVSDFLREEERTPLEYDEARHGFRLTGETFSCLRRGSAAREAFSFALARKLLAHYEAMPLHMVSLLFPDQ